LAFTLLFATWQTVQRVWAASIACVECGGMVAAGRWQAAHAALPYRCAAGTLATCSLAPWPWQLRHSALPATGWGVRGAGFGLAAWAAATPAPARVSAASTAAVRNMLMEASMGDMV